MISKKENFKKERSVLENELNENVENEQNVGNIADWQWF